MSQPIRDDELLLWQLLLQHGRVQPQHAGLYARDIVDPDRGLIEIAPKRAWYLCEKWADQGVYEYGTACDLGWVPPCCPGCGWFGWPSRDACVNPRCPRQVPAYA